MQLPADLRVNGEEFLHLSVRTGPASLHTALLEFYAQSFDLDRVVLRDEHKLLDRAVIADLVGDERTRSLRVVLLARGDGVVEDIRAQAE